MAGAYRAVSRSDPASANHRIDPINHIGHKAVAGLTRRRGVAGSNHGQGVRVLGAILAALVVGEVAWAGVYVVVGERQPYIWALPALAAAVTLWLMLVTTDPTRAGQGR